MARTAVVALLASLGLAVAGCVAPVRLTPREPIPVERAMQPVVARFETRSPALSRFLGRPATVGADLILPLGLLPDEELPICYQLPDLGEDPRALRDHIVERSRGGDLPRLVVAILDPRGAYGHHLFADSVNEGPRGEALVADLIPALEASLFARGSAERRFVSGIGLGGWAAARLQIVYPHAFDGAWAIEPDALDFASFYGVNLHGTANLYRGGRGEPARAGGQRVSELASEALAGRLMSFEAALGPRGDDGRPLAFFDRSTGAIQGVAAQSIVRHDIAQLLRERGVELAPKLAGRLHLIGRDRDRFGRDVSTRDFGRVLEASGLQADVRLIETIEPLRELVDAWSAMTAMPTP